MKLREEFEVAEPVSSVWTFFESPEAVAGCVPGVEQLTVLTPDDIDVRLTQSVGPMTATFAATVKIVERVPEKLISFTATGKTVRGAMGNVRATVTVQLEPAGERTVVLVEGDVALAGALGSVGQKVVAKQAGKVTAQFSRNLEAALGGGAAQPSAPVGTAAAAAAPAAARPTAVRTLPPVGDTPPAADPWSKVAAALSAVSVVLSIVALRRGRRRSRR
ncbi:MAG: carbon monoxide dehydrogenase subunit [Modestobacter sp.]|nr:carbon monoxide dehydrogenase subunit [Modestobacter sp.]